MSRKKIVVVSCFGAAGLATLLGSCTDYLTAQTPEPEGPLRVTKMTLLDKVSRDSAVFTDTSLPDCAQYNADFCGQEENRGNDACRVCYNDVFKDKYSAKKSPPTPDSATDLRVVFNKIPRKWNGKDVNPDNVPDEALRLQCDGTCVGIPAYKRLLDVSGSSLSFDPTEIPYGPSLRIAVNRDADPRAGLEPSAKYSVYLDVGFADRAGNALDWKAATALLQFSTEPLKVLQMGRGDGKADPWVYASNKYGDGSAQNPYSVADLARNSAIVLKLNAAVSPEPLATASIVGTAKSTTGTSQTVNVLVGTNVWGTEADGSLSRKDAACVQQNQRLLAFWPDTPDGRWPQDAVEVSFSVPEGIVKDVAQKAGFPTGMHALDRSVAVRTRFSDKDADSKYTGLSTTRAKVGAGHCAPFGSGDMAASDMGTKDL